MNNFRNRYCAHHGVRDDEFESFLLPRSLYPQARLLGPLARLLRADPFSVDRVTLQQVGRCREPRQWLEEVHDFRHLAENRTFVRRVLRLRLSISRLHRELSRAGVRLDSLPNRT